MKYLKKFKLFESEDNEQIIREIEDIFSGIGDFGLEVDDIYSGTSLSLGGRDIVTDHREFEMILGPDGKWIGTFQSFSIRLKSKNKNIDGFYIDEGFFQELKDSIGHVESQLGLELNSLYLRTSSGVWFKDVDTLQKWIEELPFAQRASLKWVLYLDLTFKINEQI
jgi:hypothetical protein